ncbi:myosin-13-like [Bombyx mandarina]|uniref:Uncharacterized protein n=2 Tax=Bombyx TaxID=7090 RepID=A0A8R1WQT4_BOMMO|nr:myosin-13 [Bombyx mori]XP_028029081.1 myosin-13-like [Bombyx mandarina]
MKSSYLFLSNKVKSFRIMNKYSSSDSEMSLDSLEQDFKIKNNIKANGERNNIDTILVPFYEKDVLVRISKERKNNKRRDGSKPNTSERKNKNTQQSNYLINKSKREKSRSYLEMFRKQLPLKTHSKANEEEIRSISPEFGDTERESIDALPNNSGLDFLNTEPYNEIYYEKILNKDMDQFFNNSFEEELRFTDDLSYSPEDVNDNFKSVSEVSRPRHRSRRATVHHMENVKLGGLGPDLERIKPRLERARSLQRYSEKVRMENRLKIYKRNIEADEKMKSAKDRNNYSVKRNDDRKQIVIEKNEQKASYLVSKTSQYKTLKTTENLYALKTKSAGGQRTQIQHARRQCDLDPKKPFQKLQQNLAKETELFKLKGKQPEEKQHKKKRATSKTTNKAINTDACLGPSDTSPVSINFMVNVGKLRPSSALKKLEETHQKYQEQVKSFHLDEMNL